MRTAVVFFADKKRDRVLEVAQELARGIEEQGYHVDVIDGDRDVNTKLTIYNYIAVGTVALNLLSGKLSEKISKYLASAGIVAGKRSFAFVLGGGLRNGKVLSLLMKTMEHEGMIIKYSDIFNKPSEAKETGRKLHIS
jgi:menaquinone-dependent protoporphyrinogen IX oxidase